LQRGYHQIIVIVLDRDIADKAGQSACARSILIFMLPGTRAKPGDSAASTSVSGLANFSSLWGIPNWGEI
jgi:hypothetical protein